MAMNTRSMLNRFVMGMIVVAAAVLWCGTARAQSYWTNTASGLPKWSTAENWTNGAPAQYGSVSTILNFNVPRTYTSSNDWTGIFTNNGLVFGAGIVTLAGGTNAFINNDVVMPVVTNYGATVTIKNPLILATNTTFAGASNTTASGVISGSGGIVQAGSGTLTLSGANTFTGGTTISNGSTLAASVAGALGLSNSGPLLVNGTLNLTGGSTTAYTFSNSISGNGTINVTVGTGVQTVDLISDPTWTSFAGTLNIGVNQSAGSGRAKIEVDLPSSATVNATSNSGFFVSAVSTCAAAVNLWGGTGYNLLLAGSTCSGPITLYADSQIYGVNGNSTVSGNIGDGGRSCGLTKAGGNTILSGTNTYSGDTRSASSLGWFDISNDLALQNSTLDMNPNDTGSITFSQNSTLGGLKGSRDVNMNNKTLMIGNNNKDTTYSGALTNGAVIKIGTGRLELSGSNTYRGGTTVSNGTLVINGSITGAVTVATGGTLGGTGVVSGVVTNFGAITAADKGTVGTLTVTNLVMKENSTLYYDYGSAVSADAIAVAGNLTLPNVATVNVNQVSGSLPNPAVLITFAGTGYGSAASDTNLVNWVITGAKTTTKAHVVGNQVVLLSPKGCVITVQ
jgi:fibronectin-binding autotransporter adhesin